jgi:hypothetical protein
MVPAPNTSWQIFIIFIVWTPLTLVLVSGLELAAENELNPNEAR